MPYSHHNGVMREAAAMHFQLSNFQIWTGALALALVAVRRYIRSSLMPT